MALVYDNTRSPRDGGGWVERPDTQDWITRELPQLRRAAAERYEASKRRWGVADRIALGAVGAGLGMGVGGAILGGAGGGLPSFATEGIGFSAAPAATSLSAGVPWLRLSQIGVGAGMDLYGQHQAGKAADRAFRFDEEAFRQNQANLDRQFALEREAFDADQEQQRLDRAAADEERAYTRKLSDEREGRRAPYRAVSRNALYSLADIARVSRG